MGFRGPKTSHWAPGSSRALSKMGLGFSGLGCIGFIGFTGPYNIGFVVHRVFRFGGLSFRVWGLGCDYHLDEYGKLFWVLGSP